MAITVARLMDKILTTGSNDDTTPANLGTVVSVRGSVIDIRFDRQLPPIYSLLLADEG